MKVTIMGAGAVGSLLAARLSATGAEVSLIAHGAALDAIRRNGVTMITPLRRVVQTMPPVTDDAHALGRQDVVFLCTKAYALRGVLDTLPLLMGRHTVVVPIVNGIPWWYPYDQPGVLADGPLESVDPGGVLWRTINPVQVVGAASSVAVEYEGPGRIRHVGDQRFVFGNPGNRPNPMVGRIVDLFGKAGFQSRASDNIREAVWSNLWSNLGFSPLSVLTGATLSALCLDPGTRAVGRAIMAEAWEIAHRLGVTIEGSIDEAVELAAGLGDFKTPMLKDFEAGRRLETAAGMGAAIELAERVGVATPAIRAALALVEMRVNIRDGIRQSAA